jgi:hypothetical protein
MTRPRKILLGVLILVGAVAMLFFVGRYYLTSDFRAREATLRPLLETNAPLDVVIAEAGNFTITRRSTPIWDQMYARYSSGSKWDRHIATKMEKAAAYGHTSTMYMQTWIFLDEHDRLIDFEIGTQ